MSRKPKAGGAAVAVPRKNAGFLGGRTFKTDNFKRNLKSLRYGMDNMGSHVRKTVALMDAVLSYLEEPPGTNWESQVEETQVNIIEQMNQSRSSSLAKGVIDLLQTPPIQELLGELAKAVKKRSDTNPISEVNVTPTTSVTPINSSIYGNLPKNVRGIQL
ncbi:MAG: hypothetical protein M0Z31_12630 [Clostridia bacterium]|nr:hypothetical protein [Clostridia bacterium]